MNKIDDLSQIKDEALSILKEKLNDENIVVRRSNAKFIGKLGNVNPRFVLPILEVMRNSQDEYIQELAMKKIEKLKDS